MDIRWQAMTLTKKLLSLDEESVALLADLAAARGISEAAVARGLLPLGAQAERSQERRRESMATLSGVIWKLRACPACGCDLYAENEDDRSWHGFLCGREYDRERKAPEAKVEVDRQELFQEEPTI